MRHIALLLTILLTLSPFAQTFGADRVIKTRSGENLKFAVDGNIDLNGGPKILNTNKDLQGDDFPNTTTLYGWNLDGNGSYDGAAFVGAKALTENGALSGATDVLGNTRFVDFDGTNDWLSSTDAAFNFVGDFSLSFWVYRASWATPGTTFNAITRTDNADGWKIYIGTDDTLAFFDISNATRDAYISTLTFSAGWHHIAVVRDVGTSTTIYLDGKVTASTSSAVAFTAAGNLEVGALNGGSEKFTGRLDEVAVHDGTLWTETEVSKIYARSSRKFTLENIDGSLNVQSRFSIPIEKDASWSVNSSGNLLGLQVSNIMRSNTSDASDTSKIQIVSGGSASPTRGAYISLHGNEHSSAGRLDLVAGNDTGGVINVSTNDTLRWVFSDGSGEFIGQQPSNKILSTNDTSALFISGGSATVSTNGAYLKIEGNDLGGGDAGGKITYNAGNTAGASGHHIFNSNGSTRFRILENGDIEAPSIYTKTTGSAANVFIDSGTNSLNRSTSAAKYKSVVRNLELEVDTSYLYSLRPIIYKDKVEFLKDPNSQDYIGFLADEVNPYFPQIVEKYNGEVEGLAYTRITALIVAEMKKLKLKNEQLEARIAVLEAN